MENNALTSKTDWDNNWEKHKDIRLLKKNDLILGYNGAFLRSFRDNAGALTNKKVMELGGASSYYLLSMSMFENVEATAVDYVESGLKHLEVIFQSHDKKVETICADIFKYDFTEKYDFVVHWGLLEHFVDPFPVIEVSAKALNSSGKLVFSMPNLKAFGVGLWKRYDLSDYNKHIYHADENIINSAKMLGLILEKKYYWGYPIFSNIGYWRANKLFSFIVKNVIRFLSLINRVFPFYHKGNSWFSSSRTFVFRKENVIG